MSDTQYSIRGQSDAGLEAPDEMTELTEIVVYPVQKINGNEDGLDHITDPSHGLARMKIELTKLGPL